MLSTTEVAKLLSLTRQGVLARVKAGTLTPVERISSGYVFDDESIQKVAPK